MKSTLRLWLTAVPGTLLVPSALFSYGNGVYPGYVGTGGMVPTNVTRIAPSCEAYVGTDFSATALQYLQQWLAQAGPAYARTTLQARAADDFSGMDAGSFDVVVLNSVVQYFPSADYLVEVLVPSLWVRRLNRFKKIQINSHYSLMAGIFGVCNLI